MTAGRGVTMRTLGSERGLALPMVILIIAVLTVLVAAGFSAASSERRVNANEEATLDAFTTAETGLELFLGGRDSFGFTASPPAVTESTRIVFTGAYADVVLRQMRVDTVAQRWGYVVRSHAVNTVKALRGTPGAERTVAEYAVWQPGTMSILSSWTSLSGLHKNGASSMGTGGFDECGKMPAVGGVGGPPEPRYTQNGSGTAPQGNPPELNVAPTPAQIADQGEIDWAGNSLRTAESHGINAPPASWPRLFG